MNWVPPDDLDRECLKLCQALNEYPGIETSGSCCGHGKHPYMVFFEAESIEALAPIAYYCMTCHCGFTGWSVIAHTDCSMRRPGFIMEGPIGAYGQADDIAALLREALPEILNPPVEEPA